MINVWPMMSFEWFERKLDKKHREAVPNPVGKKQ